MPDRLAVLFGDLGGPGPQPVEDEPQCHDRAGQRQQCRPAADGGSAESPDEGRQPGQHRADDQHHGLVGVELRDRLVLEPQGAQLEPGEILVAPSTDPGWTPLFLTAGGLVMEMGGANSHGAVVAREYGIPAVVGVSGATSQITTGQQVTVDGTRGVVTAEATPG